MEPNQPHRSSFHPHPLRASSSPHLLSHSPSRPLPPHFGSASRPSSRTSSRASSPPRSVSSSPFSNTPLYEPNEFGTEVDSFLNNNHDEPPAHDESPKLPVEIKCCCEDPNCENNTLYITTIRALENEVQLAGEVGQALLQRHETFVRESEEAKASLQLMVTAKNREIESLQQIAEQLSQANQELQKDQQRMNWDVQKAEKSLRTMTVDLETSQARLNNTLAESDARASEIEKLRVFKAMVKQGAEREESLKTKLDDTKQELTLSRRNESSLEGRYKKIKGRYDSLHNAHEKMKREYQELTATGEKYKDLAWLKESNEKLRNDVIKLTSPFKPPLTDPRQMHNNHLINLIKELAASNNKLKSDLVEYKEMLSDSRNELLTLRSKVEEIESTDPAKTAASSIAGTGPASRERTPTGSVAGSVTPTADEFSPSKTSFLDQPESLAWISSSAPQPTPVMMFGAAAVGRLSDERERSQSRERRGHSSERGIASPISIDHAPLPRPKHSVDTLSSELSTPFQSVPHTPTAEPFSRSAHPGPIDIPFPLSGSASTITSAVSASGSPPVVHHHHHHYHYHLHRRKSSSQVNANGANGSGIAGDDETETVEIIKEEVVVETPGGSRSLQGGRAFEAAGGILALVPPHEDGEILGGKKVGFMAERPLATSPDNPSGGLSPADLKKSIGSPSLLSASFAGLNKEKEQEATSIGVQADEGEDERTKQRGTTKIIGFPEAVPSSRRSSLATDGKRRADIGVGYFAPPFTQIGGEGERRARGFGSWREPIVTRVTVMDVPEDVIAERMRDAATSPITEFDRQLNYDSEDLPHRRSIQFNPPHNKWTPAPLPLALSAPSMSHMFATPPPVSPKNPGSIASNASGSGTQNPYASLHGLGTHLLDRLRGTDIRALNRRLRRAFDILELSGMSNSIIENVLTDVEVLRERFRWVEEARETTAGGESRPITPAAKTESRPTTPASRPTTPGLPRDADATKERERERRIDLLSSSIVDDFPPLVHLIQDLLGEIGKLRMTVNDLQVEYVKKVEENQRWVEEGIIKKMESRAREGRESGGVMAGRSRFAWLAALWLGYRPGRRWDWRQRKAEEEAYRNRGRSVDRGMYQRKRVAQVQEQLQQRQKHTRTVSHESVTSMLLDRREEEAQVDGWEGGSMNGNANKNGSGGRSKNGGGNKDSRALSISTSRTEVTAAVPTLIGKPPRGRNLIPLATTTAATTTMTVMNEAPEGAYRGATSYLASSVFEPKGNLWRSDTAATGSKYGAHVSSRPNSGDSRRRSRLTDESAAGSSTRSPRPHSRRDDMDPGPTPMNTPGPGRTITISTPSSPRGGLSRTNPNSHASHHTQSISRSRTVPSPKPSTSTPPRSGRGRSRDRDSRGSDGQWGIRSRPPSPDAELDVNWKVGSLYNAGWAGNK